MLQPDEVARAVAYPVERGIGLMTGSIIDFDQQVLGCYESAPQPPPSQRNNPADQTFALYPIRLGKRASMLGCCHPRTCNFRAQARKPLRHTAQWQ